MEKLYQYLWKHRMLGRSLTLDDGASLEIVDPGRLNMDAGPDFSNARLRIDGTDWAGNVEIHVRASDWYRHGHDRDRAYDSVALHVVAVSDTEIRRADGRVIPQLTATFPESFFAMYSTLCEGIANVKCSSQISELPQLVREDWLETLAMERLQMKARRILDLASACGGDWERVCFITLARALGFGLNGEPFEIMARSVPLAYLNRHADNLMQLESILFGQAGMLDSSENIFDEYYQSLCREYYFLARKYCLRPMRRDLWKYARTRPGNFPHRRVALLAAISEGGFRLMSRILEAAGDMEKTKSLFEVELSSYWHNHLMFGGDCGTAPALLGEGSILLLMVNMVAPILYAHGAFLGEAEDAEKGVDLWKQLKPESNTFIRYWKALGFDCADASRSQALLQLRREYCDAGRCLDCRFGHWLLRERAGGFRSMSDVCLRKNG